MRFNIFYPIDFGFIFGTPVFFIGYLLSKRGSRQALFERTLNVNAFLYALANLLLFILYFIELILAWYSGYLYEENQFATRSLGPLATFYWIMLVLNTLLSLAFFIKRIRNNLRLYFLVWLILVFPYERVYVLFISMHQDYLPSSWELSYGKPLLVSAIYVLCLTIFCSVFPQTKKSNAK